MRPDRFALILGRHFVGTSTDPVLVIGARKYDRFQLGEIGIPHIKAARTLHLLLQRLSIKTPAQLASRIHDLPTIEGVGTTTMYAALALLTDCQQESAAITDYNHAAAHPTRPDTIVTFTTLKARERRRQRLHAAQTNPRRRRGKNE